MDKISFLKSIKEIEFDDKGNLVAVKGYIVRDTNDFG